MILCSFDAVYYVLGAIRLMRRTKDLIKTGVTIYIKRKLCKVSVILFVNYHEYKIHRVLSERRKNGLNAGPTKLENWGYCINRCYTPVRVIVLHLRVLRAYYASITCVRPITRN